jgi:hypothetical protein
LSRNNIYQHVVATLDNSKCWYKITPLELISFIDSFGEIKYNPKVSSSRIVEYSTGFSEFGKHQPRNFVLGDNLVGKYV